LAEISAQLNQARLDLREAEQGRDEVRKQLSNEKSEGGSVSKPMSSPEESAKESAISVATPEIDARIEAQKRNLDGLLQRFTELHPDIVSTRKLIRELEEQKQKEVQELRKVAMASPAGTSTIGNMVIQELNRSLATSEVQVAALKARVSEYSSRYNQARESMKSAPRLEAEASQLNRDYAITKRNYEDLVTRRESAAMSGELDLVAGVADFRLIDPPRVSPKPVSPNRMFLLLLMMVLSLAAGLFTAFAASQLRPVFHSLSELRAKVAFPLLGVVSLITGDSDIRREKVDLLRFLVSSGSLIGIFVVGLITMSVIAARQG
jgi:polysaccharide chain length determinant protein (PEP-CTERM system associated)